MANIAFFKYVVWDILAPDLINPTLVPGIKEKNYQYIIIKGPQAGRIKQRLSRIFQHEAHLRVVVLKEAVEERVEGLVLRDGVVKAGSAAKDSHHRLKVKVKV